jgi:hypothetical protein
MWETVSAGDAIMLGASVPKRCSRCHGSVRVYREPAIVGAQVEHVQRHAGCPLDDSYDGKGFRPHPMQRY